MEEGIKRLEVATDRFGENWGVKVYDYTYGGYRTDLQDLLVSITQHRATAIEQQILPLRDIIARRNTRIERYGAVLQKLTELQSKFAEKDAENVQTVQISTVLTTEFTADDFWAILRELGLTPSRVNDDELTLGKSEVEGAVARCKNDIDTLNNDSQRDMTRLQSVVDRRDESFSAATNLMTSVSDTRSSLIKNL